MPIQVLKYMLVYSQIVDSIYLITIDEWTFVAIMLL